jgi:hypothetical protein
LPLAQSLEPYGVLRNLRPVRKRSHSFLSPKYAQKPLLDKHREVCIWPPTRSSDSPSTPMRILRAYVLIAACRRLWINIGMPSLRNFGPSASLRSTEHYFILHTYVDGVDATASVDTLQFKSSVSSNRICRSARLNDQKDGHVLTE